jgi:putative glutamine amidotransferase
MAIADDGLIEAVFHPDHPFLGSVQWHPVFCDPAKGPGTVLFRAFAEAAVK